MYGRSFFEKILKSNEAFFFFFFVKYNFVDIREFTVADSFTQIVWKETTSLGLDLMIKDGYVIVLALYDPPGNVKGRYAANVTELPNTSGS